MKVLIGNNYLIEHNNQQVIITIIGHNGISFKARLLSGEIVIISNLTQLQAEYDNGKESTDINQS